MKKIILAFCALAMVAMVSCKKDDPKPGNGTTPGNPPAAEQQREGEFSPAAKIHYVEVDGQPSEEWVWVEGLLNTVRTANGNGAYTDAIRFTYDGKRVSELTYMGSLMSGTLSVEYSGDYMSAISLVRDGVQLLSAHLDHNSQDKISHMEISIDSAYINELLDQLTGGFSFGKGPDVMAKAVTAVAKAAGDSKLAFNSADASVDIEWDGDNASRMMATVSVNGSVTLNEINSVMDLSSYLGEYSGILLSMFGDMPLPLTLTVGDTIDYTYDTGHNPMQGYMGSFDVSMFSANNVLTSNSYGMMSATLSINLMGFSQEVPFSYPIPSSAVSHTYTYNEAGFPLTVTDSDSRVTAYTYME